MTYLTVREAATRVHVTSRTVQNWIRDGLLPARRFGPKVVRIDPADLEFIGRPIVADEFIGRPIGGTP